MTSERPFEYGLRVAKNKAQAAAAGLSSGIVVAADTIVIDPLADDKAILGKPSDRLEAAMMLRRLRGRIHQVYTALAVIDAGCGFMLTDSCLTDVPMRNYTDEEIMAYIDTGDPLDKAGAYAIQHKGFHPVESLEGCFANVMGLPLCHLNRTLIKMGIYPATHLPTACQSRLKYACPVYGQILGKEGNSDLELSPGS